MRILLVMPIGSPWSRNTALCLSRLGHDVHVVDILLTHSLRLPD